MLPVNPTSIQNIRPEFVVEQLNVYLHCKQRGYSVYYIYFVYANQERKLGLVSPESYKNINIKLQFLHDIMVRHRYRYNLFLVKKCYLFIMINIYALKLKGPCKHCFSYIF